MKKKPTLTPELLLSGLAVGIAILALIVVSDNKPVISGYREVTCEVMRRSNGATECMTKLTSPEEEIRVFVEAH